MGIMLEINPQVAERLIAHANDQGVSVDDYLEIMLAEAEAFQVQPPRATLAKFKTMLDALAEGSENRPVLSDMATTRGGIYADHD